MKKAVHITKQVLVYLVVILAVFMMTFTVVSVTTFNRNDRDLFGFKMFIVNSDSMSKTDFKAGDLIYVKEVVPSSLKVGEIITFISQDPTHFGETVTHKIRKLTTDAEGNPAFVTYGTTTDTNDETVVTYPYVLGLYQGRIPAIGTFFNFLKTPLGYFLCIFTPFMLIILFECVKLIVISRRYKKEQMAAMQAEKEKIESERAENARMLLELQALKAQLSGQQNATDSENDPQSKNDTSPDV